MTDPQYATPEYGRVYRALAKAHKDRDLECVQPRCLVEEEIGTRVIPRRLPGQPSGMDVAHDDTGTVILGPAHRRCNRADGGRRRSRPTPKRAVF